MDLMTVIAVLAAFVIKGLSGFANTLVFGTIMSFQANTLQITPLELLIGYPSNLLMAWKERRSISSRVWMPLAFLVILGSIPGAFLLKNAPTALLKLFFGFAVAGIGIEMWHRERQQHPLRTPPLFLGLIGMVSGLLCGLFGVGAFLVAYISRTTDNPGAFRGNICLVFLVENTFRILLYAGTGILTAEILRQALLLAPLMLIGLSLGLAASAKISDKAAKKAVLLLLIFSGISLILRSFSLLAQQHEALAAVMFRG